MADPAQGHTAEPGVSIRGVAKTYPTRHGAAVHALEVVEIDLPRPRDQVLLKDPAFRQLVDRLQDLAFSPALAARP